MDTKYQKQLASKILKCSPKRVKVSADKDIEEALTRNDVKGLIKKKLIVKKPKKGTSRVKANFIAEQKKKGRRRGKGKKSGTKYARGSKKDSWMKTTRALRKLLKELREKEQIDKSIYGLMYRRVKGGEFKNKKRLLSWLSENKHLKGIKKGDK